MTMTSRRILVVDDEKSLCDYLAILLRREGYQVDVSTSVDDAFERLPRVRYDLVLSDLMIGNRSGLEIVQALNTAQTPIVLMTAYGTVEKAVEALRMGASDFILKPFQNEVMIHALRKALESNRPDEANPSSEAKSNPGAGSGSAEKLQHDLVGSSPSIQDLRT
ncbi:MAG: response regulator, partial [Fibrobacterota bacterium]